MAPTQKRSKNRPPTSFPAPTSAFSATKKDKQAIKHSVLLSKIAKSAPASSQKRRRPNKKLVATLESLADALPDVADDDEDDSGVREVGQARVVTKRNTEKNKSLSSRKGVTKRRAKLEEFERKRMGMNLATMATSRPQAGTSQEGEVRISVEGSGMEDRWAALRRHVEANMEKKAEFVK